MIHALTGIESLALERRAVEERGVTLSALMARAGEAVAVEAAGLAPEGRIVLVTGKGNNGGDGWAAAARLHAAGREVRVLAFGLPDDLPRPAGEAAEAAIRGGVDWTAPQSAEELLLELRSAACVVDALFGVGFTGVPRDPYAAAIAVMSDVAAPILAVDVPSGVDATTGATPGPAVIAARTVCFSAPKTGLLLLPGAFFAGEVVVVDIGVPGDLVDEVGTLEVWDRGDYRELIPLAGLDAHKGSRGRVLVVGGSAGMTGAVRLACVGALRMGAGYVTAAVPVSVADIVDAGVVPAVVVGLPETDTRSIATGAVERIAALAERADAVVLGPGMSRHPETAEVARRLVRELSVPLVVDADALVALAADLSALSGREFRTVLTPHPGELASLLGVEVREVQADRVSWAGRLAVAETVCVLKGARTIVAGEGRQVVTLAGNPGLATGGTGDVLAGMMGTLLAQGLPALEAGALAAYLHGRAGDLAAGACTQTCMTAEDVPLHLPGAVAETLERSEPATGGAHG
ncbi:MAG: NAD(P)H-hydrate dehydratase [Coriobacteriia bacterium]